MNKLMSASAILVFFSLGISVALADDDCRVDGKQCVNGGQCVNSQEGPSCLCPGGYYGRNCENGIPFCLQWNTRCLNEGECILAGDSGNAFCRCKQPYYGARCEYAEPIDEFCSVKNRCGAHGICIKAGDGFPAMCLCKRGYTGKFCESPL